MINKCVKKYCKDFEKIENYEKAIADTTQTWECHHRLEEFVSKKWLVEHNDYYNVSPNELIFLTEYEHKSLHKNMKGKHHSEETKKKMSEMQKRKIVSETSKEKNRLAHLGKHHSEETKKKMSEVRKGKKRPNISKALKGEKNGMFGKHHTEETKRKISETKLKNKEK